MNKTIKIIAEVGVNHNGSLKLAIKYLDACKRIGVDYVKFQLAIQNLVVTSLAKKATYQIALLHYSLLWESKIVSQSHHLK